MQHASCNAGRVDSPDRPHDLPRMPWPAAIPTMLNMYGSGFAHCCEGERCQPADTSLIERPGQPTNDDLHTVLRRLYCAGQT
jgi:hypothetical protein